jgi:hypothetical protein
MEKNSLLFNKGCIKKKESGLADDEDEDGGDGDG